MALLAKGLVESSAKRTLSSLGDRSQYIGMSDIGRALECPRAAVGKKLFGNSADLEVSQHDLALMLGTQLRLQRGHWFEAGVAQVFRTQGLPVIEQLEIQATHNQVPIKAHLDFTFVSAADQPTVRILELKSCENIPSMLYSSYETQVYGQVGLLRALWNKPAFGVHGEPGMAGCLGLTFPELCRERLGIKMPADACLVDIEAWVLCLSMSEAKAFGPYLPDKSMLGLCLQTAEDLWTLTMGVRSNGGDIFDLPTAKGFHALCPWCDFNADCPKFEGVDQPQWSPDLERLARLKADSATLDREISEVEDGLKTAYRLSAVGGNWINSENQRFRVSSQSGRRSLNREQLRLELSPILGEDECDALLARCESEGKSFERLMVSKINKPKERSHGI
jgi:hypothetical protein